MSIPIRVAAAALLVWGIALLPVWLDRLPPEPWDLVWMFFALWGIPFGGALAIGLSSAATLILQWRSPGVRARAAQMVVALMVAALEVTVSYRWMSAWAAHR